MPGSDRCTPPGNGAGHPDAHRKPESTDRGQASEEQAGPSRQTNRQGYCSYCRVLYTGLEQHISSSRHRQSVRVSSRGSSTTSSVSRTSRSSSLMDRFLQDVLLHHPYSYTDTRSSRADLPSVSCPPVPRADLAELCVTDSSDSQSVCTRDDLSSAPSEQQQPRGVMATELGNQEAGQEKLSQPITRQQEVKRTQPTTHPHTHVKAHSLHAHTRVLQSPSCTTPSSVHRKAHRKTNRRRETRTSPCSVTPPHRPPDHTSLDHTPKETPSGHKPLDHTLKETPSGHKPLDHTPKETPSGHKPLDHTPKETPSGHKPLDHTPTGHTPKETPSGHKPLPAPQTWTNWQKERRETHRERMFPTDDITDPVDQTIEEVIQQCCHGDSTSGEQQGETESFHFSLPESLCSAALTDDWDLHVQEALERGGTDRLHPHSPALHTLPQATPTQPVGTPLPQATATQDLWVLTEARVHLDDQVYAHQLDSALHAVPGDVASSRRRSREGEEGYRVILPIEQVLPAPAFIPPSFMGKTWAQIEQEDEEKVESMVREFRHGKFICYFDTESLIRYGRRRSQNKKGRSLADGEEQEDDSNHLPLANRDDEPQCTLRRRRRRRLFRLASRCQVVKVSHGTQTAPLVVPAVRQQPLDQQTTNQDAPHPRQAEQEERTPDRLSNVTPLQAQTSLVNVITPLQAQTSLVYILCSPDTGAQLGLHGSSHHKRCRKRRRPLDGRQGTRLKYKPLPLQFYDPLRHCVVSSLPEGWSPLPKGRGIVPQKRGVLPKGRHVRQLFRSLSPELNAERQEGASASVSRKRKGGASGSTGVKGRRSSSGRPSKGGDHFLPSMLSADATKTSSNQGTTGGAKEKRGRGGRRTSQSERGSGRGGRRTSQSERGSGRGGRRTSQSEQGSGRGGRRTSQSERGSGRGRRKRPRESSLSPQPRKWSSPRLSESRKAACSTGPLIDSSPSRCLRSGRTRN